MIAIVDTGIANRHSVKNALDFLCVENVVSADPEILTSADKLIFPGVGAFRAGMKALQEKKLIPVLHKLVLEEKKPILGICLGFQLFAEMSEEQGLHEGLGWIPGRVRGLKNITTEKVPHIGFNSLKTSPDSLLFSNKPEEADYYFVHSYYFDVDPNYVSATACYGANFPVAIEYENISGVQFHPEKSKKQGLMLLENFARKADA